MKQMQEFKSRQKFNSLPEELKILCKWHQWIMWDLRRTGNSDTYRKYYCFRMWLIETLDAMGITKDMLPVVNEKNFMSIWFEVENKFHKQTLLDMTHEFYEIKNMHKYFMMVEVE